MRILGNPLLTPYVGPFVDHPPGTTPTARVARELKLTSKLALLLPNHEVATFQLSPGGSGWLGLQWEGFRLRPSVTYRLPLGPPVSGLWTGIRGDLRREIRAAEGAVDIDTSFSPDVAAAEYLTRLDAKGVRHGFEVSMFRRLATALRNNDRLIWTLTARDRCGMIRGAALFVGDERCVYYLAGGVRPGVRGSVGGLLIWTGICLAAEVSAAFDFSGSCIPSLERLFREFGAQQEVVIRAIRMGGRLSAAEALLRHPVIT